MAEVVQQAPQEFWRPPASLHLPEPVAVETAAPLMAEACPGCETEFMIGSRFCHACGATRPEKDGSPSSFTRGDTRDLLEHRFSRWLQAATVELSRRKVALPSWLRYLHFHEIKRWIGLPTPSLIAFMIGLGCVAGVIGVSLFFRASNLAEFQAIQMWRIEWLLGATASFVAGILLKKTDRE
jgi:hypothetical protein